MTPLNPMALPLSGSHLIEASAGTGKTFTIALLYLRLVLGPRDSKDTDSFPRPLMPPEILVMTFTNAATRELRDRVRKRLVEAAAAFSSQPSLQASVHSPTVTSHTPITGDLFAEPVLSLAPPDNAKIDPALAELRNSYPKKHWPSCARRLRLAAEWMDEAAVSTIHSWCHRMLREHAFDSGSLFALNMEIDQRPLQTEVTRDYWRTFYYPLESTELEIIARHWASPDALGEDLARLRQYATALPATTTPSQILADYKAHLAELKAPWGVWADELDALLADAAKRKVFDARKLNAKNRVAWVQRLRDWAQDPDLFKPKLSEAASKRLTTDGLAEIWKDNEAPPQHAALDALVELPAQLAALPDPKSQLLAHAVHWTQQRLIEQQQRRAELGPDDLLKHLDAAFNGPSGDVLAERIRRQFPVALVDEFQDTDPVQYRLFKRVYLSAGASQRNDCGLLLIGDPKQAIYAFRGADIYTYLQARRDTAGRHSTLGTNYRSTQEMVAAVNQLFSYAEHAEHKRGAFLFKEGENNPVPFQQVNAKGRKDCFVRNNTAGHSPITQPALTLWHLAADQELSKDAYKHELAERCASEMAQLLQEGQAGQAGFQTQQDASHSGNTAFRAVQPSDLAVLVNNGGEARAIRRALMARGIRSVYLSDKDGVFETAAASEIRLWLAACAAPDNERALRAAMATPSLGLSLAQLDGLNDANGNSRQSELIWEARVMQFYGYHQLWLRRGVLPMLHHLLADFGVATRLLGVSAGHQQVAGEGERHLTDLLHLGELLQQASQELDGEHALLRWLDEAIARPEQQIDAHRLRLESDAELVQVITIHKSKGLEYPLVFLPFITAFRPAKTTDLPLRWHDNHGNLCLSLREDSNAQQYADQERLSEDLRKLYVALTRSSHATWLGIAPLKDMQLSAIGQLINGGEPITPDTLGPQLEVLANNAPSIHVTVAPTPDPTPVRNIAYNDDKHALLAAPRTPSRRIREHWWIASYSALKYGPQPANLLSEDRHEPSTADEASALEVSDEPNERDSLTSTVSSGSLHQFPRGPSPGTFLHGVLEWAASEGFSHLANNTERRNDGLARRANRRGWSTQIPALSHWLPALLNAPLPFPGSKTPLKLAELKHFQVELEFWFAAHQVNSTKLDTLISQHTLHGAPRPALLPEKLNGVLKGFIDLVVEHEGRYYVVDWKSNYLGRDDSAYTPDAMREAVLEKRYDLQYCLYLLALHRLLRAKLPDYAIDRHLGGAVYVFLRGTEAPSRGVHAESVPPQLIEALDTLFSSEETEL
ncbi:exodeoxyribonuclease V subunit beta [Halomonas halocynthiae]|uniref:exodeoxyribonuclease V subunit beta n=1 Tax=Halomonas halocynthiae TaxID=176290 RepID=UPI00040FC15F|nr:exodeoxyribonuclease V subunit beta [Halomonas halocynthiae]